MVNQETIDRFDAKVQRTQDCWIWKASRNREGYGRFRFRGEKHLANRVAWIIARGEIPDGLCVLHRCDNPPCVNPDHLYLGTREQNNRDCLSKGRYYHSTRLTTSDLEEIRLAKGRGSLSRIAAAKNVSVSYACEIRRGLYRGDIPVRRIDQSGMPSA